MANIIPTQKAKLKEILGTIVWTGNETFYEKENVHNHSHILTYLTENINWTPCMMIIHNGQTSQIADTGTNFETNQYIIRLAVDKITEELQTDLELLGSLIIDKLVNNYAKTTAFWLNLTNLKLGEYKMSESKTLFYRDLTLDLITLKTRNLSP